MMTAQAIEFTACSTCNHKRINDDPKLHCYMFKDPVTPDGECMQHTNLSDLRRWFTKLVPIHLVADMMAVNLTHSDANPFDYYKKYSKLLSQDVLEFDSTYVISDAADFERIQYLGNWLADQVGSDEDHPLHAKFVVVMDAMEKWESVNVVFGEEDGSSD
jgi:hypothetical protein